MLEIIALVFLGKKLKREAEERGLKGAFWVVVMVLAWFFSEMIVFAIFMLKYGEENALLIGFIPAILTALGSFFLIRHIMLRQSPPSADDEELDEYADGQRKDLDHFR